MLWQIKTPNCSVEHFSQRSILEVLYEFDGPKIFTTSIGALQYLWYECAEDTATHVVRYLVVPTDEQTVAYLKDGTRTVYDALRQPWVWAVDIGAKDEVRDGWIVQLDEVPDSAKPERSVPLRHFPARLLDQPLQQQQVVDTVPDLLRNQVLRRHNAPGQSVYDVVHADRVLDHHPGERLSRVAIELPGRHLEIP